MNKQTIIEIAKYQSDLVKDEKQYDLLVTTKNGNKLVGDEIMNGDGLIDSNANYVFFKTSPEAYTFISIEDIESIRYYIR